MTNNHCGIFVTLLVGSLFVSLPLFAQQNKQDPASTARPSKEVEFANKFIAFKTVESGLTRPGGDIQRLPEDRPLRLNLRFYEGRQLDELAPKAFYRKVGRPDLAEKYAWRKTRRGIGEALGTVSIIGTITAFSWGQYVTGYNDAAQRQLDKKGPLILGSSSMVGLILAGAISPARIHPKGEGERRRLAGRYNAKLRKKLGLPDNYIPRDFRENPHGLSYSFRVGLHEKGPVGVFTVQF